MANFPQVRGLNITMVREFNPTIFQPRWFAAEKLLTDEEASEAAIDIIHSDFTAFGLPWIRITVERERLTAASAAEPYFERVVALVCSTFELLRHTPIRLIGINSEAHYKASSIEKWHALGHKLAPKEQWRKFFDNPGTQNITIRQVPRPDKYDGYVQVTVEPSTRSVPGVFVAVNDHYDLTKNFEGRANEAIGVLRDQWSSSIEFSRKVFNDIADQIA